MKSPADLAYRLARQWHNADLREQRLLKPDSWPLTLSIGKPGPEAIRNRLEQVREHLERWRRVQTGRVHWQPVRFKSAAESITVPVNWELNSPSEWVRATGDPEVRREYQILGRLVPELDPRFHSLVIRRRSVILDKPEAEVIRCGQLALQLTPGCAQGKPLRALPLAGIDSKFFERNRQLITHMLDAVFDGQASESGLEAFLGAEDEGHHWLLIADLDGQLLPFSQLRVRARELQTTPLPGHRLLLVENEHCLHQLPQTPNTIAVLGSGLNLSWLRGNWLANKRIAYWGDLDTWGLCMLARAREYLPRLAPLLMDRKTFESYAEDRAVNEPQPGPADAPGVLKQAESQLYSHLLTAENGRLEQEFLPPELVHRAIREWIGQADH
ncbi:MAG: hypothetical protein HLX50_09680 [Alteromonadaceae bacterium]|nr:hypothetical protein [Alteromonadaceae bacterium]